MAGTVWFDPWMHESDDSPGLSLLHKTAADLGQSGKESVRTALKSLGRAVAGEVSIPFVGMRVGKVLDALEEADFRRREEQARLTQRFTQVLDAGGRRDGRIVFFVDDLDRCEPRTALRLLKALRLFLNFPNCVVVLGIDRTHLEAAISAENEGLGISTESFLDKIVQLPFTIPPVHPPTMAAYVANRLPEHLAGCHAFLTAAGADHPRLVKRLINVLSLSDSLADRSQFQDGYDPRILASIVLIQDQSPALYDVLRLDPTAYLRLKPSAAVTQDASGTAVTTDSGDLWLKHVAPHPALARALLEVPVSDDLDVRPYLMLASTTTNLVGNRPTLVRGLTVFEFLFPDDEAAEVVRGTVASEVSSAGIPMDRRARRFMTDAAFHEFRRQLDVDVADFVSSGLSSLSVLREATARSLVETGSTIVVDVSGFETQNRLHPRVDLRLQEQTVATLPAEVVVSLEMRSGSTVSVGGGRLLGASGAGRLKITLSIAGARIVEREEEVDLAYLFVSTYG